MLSVFDINNKEVHSEVLKVNADYQFGARLKSGIYIVSISQGDKVQVIRLIKQ